MTAIISHIRISVKSVQIYAVAAVAACAFLFAASCASKTDGTATVYNARQIAAVTAATQSGAGNLHPVAMGDNLFADYVTSRYLLDADTLDDGAVYYADGADATEIAIFQLSDSADAKKTADALKDYKERRISSLTGYMPEQAQLAENGVILTKGAFAALFICAESIDAQTAFADCFKADPPKLPDDSLFGSGTKSSDGDAGDDGNAADNSGLQTMPTDSVANSTENGSKDNSEDSEDSSENGDSYTPGTVIPDSPQGNADASEERPATDGQPPSVSQSPPASQSPLPSDAPSTQQSPSPTSSPSHSPSPVSPTPSASTAPPSPTTSLSPPTPSTPSASSSSPPPTPTPPATSTSPSTSPSLSPSLSPSAVPDAYDPEAVLTAWRTGDSSLLSDKNLAIFIAASDVISKLISANMKEYDKELAIHDFIVQQTTYDVEANSTSPNAKPDPDNNNPYGVFYRGKSICSGYSSTFQLFMDMLGIECITVKGYARERGNDHAWNMVKLDGEWYCVDVTWDDPTWDTPTGNAPPGHISHDYFNVTSQFLKDTKHIWDSAGVPEATAVVHAYKG